MTANESRSILLSSAGIVLWRAEVIFARKSAAAGESHFGFVPVSANDHTGRCRAEPKERFAQSGRRAIKNNGSISYLACDFRTFLKFGRFMAGRKVTN
jgi:hypothetical protein